MSTWETNIRKVVPYVPGEQPDELHMVKLNTNENPYPPSPAVSKAIQDFKADTLRLYPDPASSILVDALADYLNVDNNQIFVGVGSDDVLALSFLTFFNSGKPILFPDITYSFYDVWADLYRIPYDRPALDADFRIVREDYYKENGGIIFPNPNAPTGVFEDVSFIEDILKRNRDVIVIIDEAYIDFGGMSALPFIDKYDNLLVVRTFSKSRSMAGMRIGFAIGNPVLIQYLNAVKHSFNSYTMNQVSLVCGTASVRDEAYFRQAIDSIIRTREWTKKELSALGFTFPDSCANFIFATHRQVTAKDLFEALRSEKIYVRFFNKPRIDNYLRITIGTDEEMKKLVGFLKKFLE